MRLLLIAAILPLAACQSSWEKEGQAAEVRGSGATRSFAASGFTGIALQGSDDVDVKIGATFSVTAEGAPETLDQLDIRIVDGTLRVGRKQSEGKEVDDDKGARVHVVMPRLTSASVGGSGDLSVDKAEGEFSGAVAGSGNLRIGQLSAGAATLSVAGSGDLNVSGTTSKLSASIAGSGDIDAKGLTATSADISIAGSGNLSGTVRGPASISILGSGDVELGGGARCSTSALGTGEARCS
ncbi:head GIN domain-containing protein [Sphingomonas sp. M1-B02]|uniref:head GIN domain-containing protein n=1 Tax=Sphingomonas sp. M1-B02 TaxID=3114300 RepID=UPI00223F6165|nr:head GIN domain-containing protein [Sphingomonas sp. S6-11]UZK64991.1 DUF2807 domain-containing protein [Sphingomonas sp. S6-11]